MKQISRGKVFIYESELKKLFGLPEEVSIIDVKAEEYGTQGFTFYLASSEDIKGLTLKLDERVGGLSNIRRARVPFEGENK